MNDIINQEYTKEKEEFTKAQKNALNMIIKKEKEITKIKNEITKVLKENNLNNLDVSMYKQEKKVENL